MLSQILNYKTQHCGKKYGIYNCTIIKRLWMTFLFKYRKNIFIIFFIVAAISLFSLADILVTKDVAAEEKQSCVTSKCHADMGKGKYVHGPVSVLQCTICHVPTADEHVFKTMENEGKLCNLCHDRELTGEGTHPPVKERKCTRCHDPHQSPNQFMLRDEGAWILPNIARLPVVMLSQIFSDKTIDDGK